MDIDAREKKDMGAVSREVVSGIYRVLLSREPDEGGLIANCNHFIDSLEGGNFDKFLSSFLNSEEGRSRQSNLFIQNLVRPIAAAINDSDIEHFISLGAHCYTASLLALTGLKRKSFPFDWIFSSPDVILHCIEDDFKTFLDRSKYEFIPIERRLNPHVNLCEHSYYRDNFGISSMFNHRNPINNSDYEYISRCVERFKAAVSNQRASVFISAFRSNKKSEEAFLRISEKIGASNGMHAFIAISIEEGSSLLPETFLTHKEEGKVNIISYKSCSRWLDTKFESPIDDYMVFAKIVETIKSIKIT